MGDIEFIGVKGGKFTFRHGGAGLCFHQHRKMEEPEIDDLRLG
jgi:hypothetical protein